MALSVGTQIGPYTILSAIGAGGMGEVYRATDTNLARQVAIKVLPEAVASYADRLARFDREAKTLASLNHPNIAQIYGLEQSDGLTALVMELVEGDDLSKRIAQGPISVDEALPIAKQIAEALEAAHEQGIIHRDLKPANVKVRPDGTVKVLDFGLAKAMDADRGAQDPRHDREDPRFSQSPTITTPAMTQAGMILGTAAYMSPEQAKGRTVDKRSDVWAFGALLYEMLSGTRAFAGEDVSETLADVMRIEPAWEKLPDSLSPSLLTFLKRCLQKDSRQRLGDMRDMRLALEGAFETTVAPVGEAPVAPPVVQPAWRQVLVLAATAIVVGLVVSLAVWNATRTEPSAPQPITTFSVTLPPGDRFEDFSRGLVALSPDGTRVVYVANSQLYLREMDQMEATPVRGTDMAPTTPFFSPDGQWVGFWAAGTLRKVSVTGGAPVSLSVAMVPFGASWGTDDTIVFGQGPAGILRVAANGGTPEVLIPMDSEKGERGHGPQMLPDGNTVLFTLSTTASWDESQIVVQSLDTGERRVLMEGGSDARYVSTGHLVYAVAGTLLARPFDVERLQVTGGPVPVVEGVARAGSGTTGAAHASVSDSGSLVYVPETSVSQTAAFSELVQVDREGNASLLTDTRGDWETPRFSPDGRRLAVRMGDPDQDIWILELSRGTLQRLTFDLGFRPLWSPDGKTIFFVSVNNAVFSTPADASGPAEQLTRGVFRVPASITSDGQTLIFRQGGDAGSPNLDIGMMRLEEGGEPALLLDTSFNEHTPKLSPDDRWLAYVSDESGRDEIYVTGFPTGGKWQISTEGGTEPMWSRDGRELFYRKGEAMMVVAISAEPELSPGRPTELFKGPFQLKVGSGATNYDVTPDSDGFVMIRTPERPAAGPGPTQQINVVLNWDEELKRLVPVN